MRAVPTQPKPVVTFPIPTVKGREVTLADLRRALRAATLALEEEAGRVLEQTFRA